MFFLLRFFLALLIAGQALLRWPHWNPRYSRMFVERRQEPLPFPAKLIRGEVAEAGVRLRPLQVEGVDFGAFYPPPETKTDSSGTNRDLARSIGLSTEPLAESWLV